MKRRTLLALVGALMAAAVPAVAAAVMLWTLVGLPLTTTVNQSTTFTLTATNLDLLTELGCLEVDLPASFVIESLGTPQASNGDAWQSYRSGNAVIVHSLSGGGRLEILETVQFTIRAHATVAGVSTWPNHAHRQQDCSTADQLGVPLAVTVLPAILPTPTPTPMPTATPAPTPTPAPTATPKPTPTATPKPLPTIIPTLPPLPTLPLPTIDPRSLLPSPTATPRETTTPEASESPQPGDRSAGAVPTPGPGGSATLTLLGGRGAEATGADTDVGVELFGLLDADFVWFVPAASVAVPGLLVILWVLLQTIGALAWIPAVRRMGDEKDPRGARLVH